MYCREILPWNGDFGFFADRAAERERNKDQHSRPRAYTVFDGVSRGPRPPCFESEEQWLMWQKFDEVTKSGATNYCADCTPNYASRMRAEGRCIQPLVRFYRIGGALVGSAKPPQEYECEETISYPIIRTEVD